MTALPGTQRGDVDDVVSRIERIPISRWHLRTRFIVGVATFFDGFDALAIAYVLPVLAPEWHLTPAQIGLLLSASFFGQLVAGLLFGWLAERFGRVPVIMWSTAIYSVMSLACAFAWDYNSLLVLRTLQGIGIGAEVPVAMTYIAELSRTQNRGRFMLLYEIVFPLGLVAAVLVGIWVVPHFGWRWLFVIGAVPALLVFFYQRLLPESPRWLATQGRHEEANAVISLIEQDVERTTAQALPAPKPVVKTETRLGSWTDLFQGQYLRRTLSCWVVWACVFFCNFGLSVWLPTLYRTVFQMSVSDALTYTLATQIIGLIGTLVAAFFIDKMPRRAWFGGAFAFAAILFLALWTVQSLTAIHVMIIGSAAYFFISLISIGVYLYTPEIYPTRVRAFGMSAAGCWARIASFAGPNVIGALVGSSGLQSVFLCLASVALFGAVVAGLALTETRRKVLEEISP